MNTNRLQSLRDRHFLCFSGIWNTLRAQLVSGVGGCGHTCGLSQWTVWLQAVFTELALIVGYNSYIKLQFLVFLLKKKKKSWPHKWYNLPRQNSLHLPDIEISMIWFLLIDVSVRDETAAVLHLPWSSHCLTRLFHCLLLSSSPSSQLFLRNVCILIFSAFYSRNDTITQQTTFSLSLLQSCPSPALSLPDSFCPHPLALHSHCLPVCPFLAPTLQPPYLWVPYLAQRDTVTLLTPSLSSPPKQIESLALQPDIAKQWCGYGRVREDGDESAQVPCIILGERKAGAE